MDPSAELLQLLREIRDGQHELLLTMRAIENLYENDKKEREPDLKLWREATEYTIGRHDRYLRSQERLRRVGIASCVILFVLMPIMIVVMILGFSGVFD